MKSICFKMAAQTALTDSRKKIVIIGGGFAGLNLAKKLGNHKSYQVTLVDRNNYNYFPPLVYQVATSFLDTSNISYPFRKLFRKKENIQFRLGEFIKVDPASHTCYLNNGTVQYDYLVFANGSVSNYFGNETLQKNAIPMKTVNDALGMRNTLLQTLEQATLTNDPAERTKLLTIVVVGGGPTGVEVSGVLAELRRSVLRRDYPELAGSGGNIYLVEGAPALLSQMSVKSQQASYNALTKIGVKIKLNSFVKDFSDDKVVLSTGEIIETKSMIWAAGVIANTVDGIPASSTGKGKRMITDAYNKVEGVEDIYAIGDISVQKTDSAFPEGHPQLAQPAIQQGAHLGKNFIAMAEGKPLKPFSYYDKGTMAIIGRNKAVCDLKVFKRDVYVGGFIALMIWLFIHLVSLIGTPSKFKTLYNWIVAYLTKDQSLRMIIKPEDKTS